MLYKRSHYIQQNSWIKYNGKIYNPIEFVEFTKDRLIQDSGIEFVDPEKMILAYRSILQEKKIPEIEYQIVMKDYFEFQDRVVNFWINLYNVK